MEKLTLVELLDRNGRVRERHRVRSFPFTVGRAFTSDVILDERGVSRSHAQIERRADGEIVLVDRASTNGIVDVETGTEVGELIVRDGRRVKLGRAVLRFRTQDDSLVRTARIPARFLHAARARRWLWIGLWLALAGWLAASEYLTTYSGSAFSSAVTKVVGFLGFMAIWSGAWSLVSRLRTRRFDFPAHALVICLAIMGLEAASVGTNMATFAFASASPFNLIDVWLSAALLGWLLYGHLKRCARMERHRRWRIAAGVLVALALAVLPGAYDEPESEVSSKVKLSRLFFPPAFKIVSGEAPQKFFEDAGAVRLEVDQLAKKK